MERHLKPGQEIGRAGVPSFGLGRQEEKSSC